MNSESQKSISQLLSQYPILPTKSEITSTIQNSLVSKSGGYYAALNPEKIFSSRNNEHIYQILKNANFLFMDGIGAKWAYEVLLNQKSASVAGIDLMIETLEKAENNSLKVGLFGSQEISVLKTKENLKVKYPHIDFVFAVSGYEDGHQHIHSLIQNTKPDIVFVALGSPAQEQWMFENHSRFPSTLFTGVGGAFDVISGKIQRAPTIVRKMKLEWLYRFLRQPIKRWKRMITLLRFSALVLKDRIVK